ncbi:hypothetical protein V3C99_009814 [Haemonchus contortus]
MSSRGRPSGSKRGVLPNLSLAGKREDKTSAPVTLPKRKKNERRPPHRGGRGRGRGGRDGGKERPGLIESSGIFSEGLSGADPGRRVKPKVESSDGGVVTGYVKQEPVPIEEDKKVGNVPSAYAGYEELWQSDDEGDLQELSELLRDGFISDYKCGTVLPHVLPLELQSQFIDLMDNSVKARIIEEEEALKAEIDTDTKEHVLEEAGGDDEADEESPTLKHSRKAARILRNVLMSERRENELFMLQLPGILKVLSQEKPSEDKLIFNNCRPNGNAKMDATEGRLLPESNEKATVEQLSLPSGRCIGKLVITKDGRVLLKSGGHTMDVAHTASEGQHQGVVMVETAMQPPDDYAMHNGSGRFGDPHGGGSGNRNAVYYMGNVRHNFTASLDWNQLRPVGAENTSTTSADVMVTQSKGQKPADLDIINKELKELQNQRSKQITAALKRWNA